MRGIPSFQRHVTIPCEREPCLSTQIHASELQALLDAGITVGPDDAWLQVIVTLFVAASALLIAASGIWRRSLDPAVLSLSVVLTALATGEFVQALALERPAFQALADIIRLAQLAALAPLLLLVAVRRLTTRWQRLAVGGTSLLAVPVVLAPASLPTVITFSGALTAVAVAGLGVRFSERPSSFERDRLTWAAIGIVLLVGAQIIGRPLRLVPLPRASADLVDANLWIMMSTSGLILLLGGLACLAIALLRDELIEVEFVLNRTLVYGLLSVVVIVAYVLMVGLLSQVFQSSGNLWLSLVATGIVALLFQPIRTQVQHLVNQLLYGRRDDPHEVLTRLGRSLEDALPPDTVLPAIVETVASELKFPFVAISLRQPDGIRDSGVSVGTPALRTISFPLRYQGDEIGELIVAPRPGEAALGSADQQLLEDLARQAVMAAHAVRLTKALQHSREQLVAAREEERRRLRRDLHDGLGPALAAMTLQSDTARDLVRTDPDQAEIVLHDLRTQAQETMDDVRRLIHELRPPVLDDLGLIAAIRSLTAIFGQSGLAIELQAPLTLPPLPAAVEVAAYRIVQEALTNVVRHAEAQACVVRLCCNDALLLEIEDDGGGLPASYTGGVGLMSIRDRAEELGGTCHVGRGHEAGTVVSVTLPLPRGDGHGLDSDPDC